MRASNVCQIYVIQSYESIDWPEANISGSNWISIFVLLAQWFPCVLTQFLMIRYNFNNSLPVISRTRKLWLADPRGSRDRSLRTAALHWLPSLLFSSGKMFFVRYWSPLLHSHLPLILSHSLVMGTFFVLIALQILNSGIFVFFRKHVLRSSEANCGSW